MIGWRPDTGPPLDSIVDLLATGEIEIEGRLPWSSNLTFLVTVAAGASSADATPPSDRTLVQGVYKPFTGEQSLWDFPDGLYRREVAAYELSKVLGWGVVPPTIERVDGPFGVGSLQLFVEADYEQHYFTLFDAGAHLAELQRMCVFDVVANNADRKSGHVLLGADGTIWGIDHGLCFHQQHKLRTVLWDFAGDEVPSELLDDLVAARADVPAALEELLTQSELDALVERLDRLVSQGTYPEPKGDRPPYPWPLV